MKYTKLLSISLFLLLLAACANKPMQENSTVNNYPTLEQTVTGCAADKQSFDCDRKAILAMQGEFQVSFNFYETVVLEPGYQRKAPKHSTGFETVLLLEDTGNRISLQHILVTNSGDIVKHWRQDWVYESPTIWQFVGNQRFEQHARNADEVPGTWTQSVYEVNDAPRYSGSGRWVHKYGVSTWTSGRNWRPLPRREYTTRADYHLINAINRHTITPQGWTHEQDNTKVIRNENQANNALVREFGFNEYRRITGYDFSPALTYWQSTSPFWAFVRKRWNEEFARHGSIKLSFPTGDNNLIDEVFKLAEAYRDNPQLEIYQEKLADLFDRYVNVDPAADPQTISLKEDLKDIAH